MGKKAQKGKSTVEAVNTTDEAQVLIKYCLSVVQDKKASTARRDKMARSVMPFVLKRADKEVSINKNKQRAEHQKKMLEVRRERTEKLAANRGKKFRAKEAADEVVKKSGGELDGLLAGNKLN